MSTTKEPSEDATPAGSGEPRDRSSVVDVFENFFGEDINRLTPASLQKLPADRTEELAYEVDKYLESVQGALIPAEAVVLDSLTNPILISRDRTELTTTRKAKQVALYHREVVIPIQPLEMDLREGESGYLEALLSWSRTNDRLLRTHVFSLVQRLNPIRTFGQSECEEIVASVAEFILDNDELRRGVSLPMFRAGSVEEREWIEDSVWSVLTDSANSGQLGANLSFLEPEAGRLYHELAKTLGEAPTLSDSGASAEVLVQLALPAVDDIRDEDFIAIRTQADEFEEFRSVLGRVLRNTRTEVADGVELQDIFEDHLHEVRTRALLLRSELKDRSVKGYLRNSFQSYSLGAFASGTGAVLTAGLTGSLALGPLMAGTALSTVAGTLAAVLLYRPPTREARMLRFYSALLGEQEERVS